MGSIAFDRNGNPSFKGFTFAPCDVGDSLPTSMIGELKKLSPCGAVIISYGRTAELSIRINAPSRTEEPILNQQLSENPERLINGFNTNYSYSGFNHPHENTLLYTSAEVRKTEELLYSLTAAKLTPVRLQSSHLALLNLVLAHPEVRAGQRGVVAFDQGVAYAIDCLGGRWGDPSNPPRRRKLSEAEELRSFIEEVRSMQPQLLVAATPTGIADLAPVFADNPELLRFEVPGVNPLELTAYAATIL